MAKLTYGNIVGVDLGSLGKAVTDWKGMVTQLETLAKDARDGMKAKADAARWAGVNSDVTKEFILKTVKEFEDAHTEAKSIWTVLDQAHTDLDWAQKAIKEAVGIAEKKEISVFEGPDGRARCEFSMCKAGDDQPSDEDRKWKQEQEDYINGLIDQAAEIDAGVGRALAKSHGDDKANFGHTTYESLDDARGEQTKKPEENAEYTQSDKWGSGTIKPVAEFLSYRSWANSADSALHGEWGKAYTYFMGGVPSYAGGKVSKGLEQNIGGGGRHRKPSAVNKLGRFGGKVFGWPVALVATGVDFYYTPPGTDKEPGDTRVVAPAEPDRVKYGGGTASQGGSRPIM
ncbi:hypothetical protein ACZ90_25015 [Streptomyces albus subsp. albus]|nr:hypothetical protein ACZ90_25015 [Streptomyces albus subsp. albus]